MGGLQKKSHDKKNSVFFWQYQICDFATLKWPKMAPNGLLASGFCFSLFYDFCVFRFCEHNWAFGPKGHLMMASVYAVFGFLVNVQGRPRGVNGVQNGPKASIVRGYFLPFFAFCLKIPNAETKWPLGGPLGVGTGLKDGEGGLRTQNPHRQQPQRPPPVTFKAAGCRVKKRVIFFPFCLFRFAGGGLVFFWAFGGLLPISKTQPASGLGILRTP